MKKFRGEIQSILFLRVFILLSTTSIGIFLARNLSLTERGDTAKILTIIMIFVSVWTSGINESILLNEEQTLGNNYSVLDFFSMVLLCLITCNILVDNLSGILFVIIFINIALTYFNSFALTRSIMEVNITFYIKLNYTYFISLLILLVLAFVLIKPSFYLVISVYTLVEVLLFSIIYISSMRRGWHPYSNFLYRREVFFTNFRNLSAVIDSNVMNLKLLSFAYFVTSSQYAYITVSLAAVAPITMLASVLQPHVMKNHGFSHFKALSKPAYILTFSFLGLGILCYIKFLEATISDLFGSRYDVLNSKSTFIVFVGVFLVFERLFNLNQRATGNLKANFQVNLLSLGTSILVYHLFQTTKLENALLSLIAGSALSILVSILFILLKKGRI